MGGDDADMFSVRAVRPWNSRDAEPPKERMGVEPVTYDTTEQIDECTACQLPVCINCHDRKKRREQPHRKEIMLALKRGATVAECVEKYGVSRRAVNNYARFLNRGEANG